MRPELESHFAHAEISWHGSIELPEQLQDPELGSRLCDAYGMYVYFKSKVAAALAITKATA
jgi:hypothetical protein